MRKDAIMGDIKYVQLESGDFLSDPDFQLMTSEERGIYCSVIFYMYLNGGKIQNNSERIKNLTNTRESFEKSWVNVRKKFIEKNGYLTHKRVRKELLKAKKFIQHQRRAGLASAEARQQKRNAVATAVKPSLQPNKVKQSKVKQSKKKRVFTPPTLEDVKKYISDNPELKNVDPNTFWKGFNDGGWIDTQGKPVRNWKMKLRTWSNYGSSKSKTQRATNRPTDYAEQESKFGQTIE